MVDIKTLNIKIKASGYKRNHLAKQLGVCQNSLRNKTHGYSPFNVDEADCLAKLLGLSDEELLQIFFWRGRQDG